MSVQLEMFTYGHTQCSCCGKLVHVDLAVQKEYWNGKSWDREHFCSENCHHTWHIKRLKTMGM